MLPSAAPICELAEQTTASYDTIARIEPRENESMAQARLGTQFGKASLGYACDAITIGLLSNLAQSFAQSFEFLFQDIDPRLQLGIFLLHSIRMRRDWVDF